MTKNQSERLQAILNKMADYIRDHKEISFGALCTEMGMSPSSMFGYKRVLLERFKDIVYEKGVFKVVEAKP